MASMLLEEQIDWLEEQKSAKESQYRIENMEASMPKPYGQAKKKAFDLRLSLDELEEKIQKHKSWVGKIQEIWDDITED